MGQPPCALALREREGKIMVEVRRSEAAMETLLTCASVAHLAKVTPETVRAWNRRGWLPAMRTETGIRLFRRADVDALLRERGEKAMA